MAKEKIPATPAIRQLTQSGLEFSPRPYRYIDHGGAAAAAADLGVDEHAVLKTLVMEDETGRGLVVIMHGDREVSTKNLARALGVKSVNPVDPAKANRLTGYQVGGISPFGLRQALPIYAEVSIFELPRVYINAGKRGLLAAMSPEVIRQVLEPVVVEAAR